MTGLCVVDREISAPRVYETGQMISKQVREVIEGDRLPQRMRLDGSASEAKVLVALSRFKKESFVERIAGGSMMMLSARDPYSRWLHFLVVPDPNKFVNIPRNILELNKWDHERAVVMCECLGVGMESCWSEIKEGFEFRFGSNGYHAGFNPEGVHSELHIGDNGLHFKSLPFFHAHNYWVRALGPRVPLEAFNGDKVGLMKENIRGTEVMRIAVKQMEKIPEIGRIVDAERPGFIDAAGRLELPLRRNLFASLKDGENFVGVWAGFSRAIRQGFRDLEVPEHQWCMAVNFSQVLLEDKEAVLPNGYVRMMAALQMNGDPVNGGMVEAHGDVLLRTNEPDHNMVKGYYERNEWAAQRIAWADETWEEQRLERLTEPIQDDERRMVVEV